MGLLPHTHSCPSITIIIIIIIITTTTIIITINYTTLPLYQHIIYLEGGAIKGRSDDFEWVNIPILEDRLEEQNLLLGEQGGGDWKRGGGGRRGKEWKKK